MDPDVNQSGPSRPPLIAFRLTAEEHTQLEALMAEDPSQPQRAPLWVKAKVRALLARRTPKETQS